MYERDSISPRRDEMDMQGHGCGIQLDASLIVFDLEAGYKDAAAHCPLHGIKGPDGV